MRSIQNVPSLARVEAAGKSRRGVAMNRHQGPMGSIGGIDDNIRNRVGSHAIGLASKLCEGLAIVARDPDSFRLTGKVERVEFRGVKGDLSDDAHFFSARFRQSSPCASSVFSKRQPGIRCHRSAQGKKRVRKNTEHLAQVGVCAPR